MTTDSTNPATETDAPQDRNWKQVRDKLEALETQVGLYKKVALEGVVHRAGFDVNAGVTKLLMEKFEANFGPDTAAPDKFMEFAKQYGVNPVNATTAPADTTEPEGAQQMDTFQSRVDQLKTVTEPVTQPPDLRAQIAEAEAKGDWRTSAALKDQMVRQNSGF